MRQLSFRVSTDKCPNQDSSLNSLVPEYGKEREQQGRQGKAREEERKGKEKENLNEEDISWSGWVDRWQATERWIEQVLTIKSDHYDSEGLPQCLSSKRICLQCGSCRKCRFNPWVRKIPWKRAWQLTPVFLPGESHGQRKLKGYVTYSHKESNTTETT